MNLEVPLPSGPPIAKVGPLIPLDPRSIPLLAHLPVRIATLANNHIMDFSASGMNQTIQACRTANILTVGAGDNLDAALQPARLTIRGVRLSILSFCEAEFGLASENSPGAAGIFTPAPLPPWPRQRPHADVLLVAAHGGVEFFPLSPIQRARQLRSFIDTCADCVIGNHPHVPQAWEFYRSGLIFHSLGNFLFRLNSPPHPLANWSLLPRLRFSGRRLLGFDAIPVILDSAGRVVLPTQDQPYVNYLKKLSSLFSDPQRNEELWLSGGISLESSLPQIACHRSGIDGRCLRQLLHRLRGRSTDRNISAADWRKLLLLNLFRAESHRWTIESAQLASQHPSPRDTRQIVELLQPIQPM